MTKDRPGDAGVSPAVLPPVPAAGGKSLRPLKEKVLKRFSFVGMAGLLVLCLAFAVFRYHQVKNETVEHERERAVLIRTGILSAMMSTGDPVVVRYAVDNFKKDMNAGFRMVRSDIVRNQFGMRRGEEPRDAVETEILFGLRPEYTELSGDMFRVVLPFVADARCGRCHHTAAGKPVSPGTVMGMAEMTVDVGEHFKAARRLIGGMGLCMLLVIFMLGLSVYWVIYREVLVPVASVADALYRLGRGDIETVIPASATTREFAILNGQAIQASHAAVSARRIHEQELAAERRKMDRIREFAIDRTEALGITDLQDVDFIIKRLSDAVIAAEKHDSLRQVTEFVVGESKRIILGNDQRLVAPAALYLTGFISSHKESPKKGAIELALDEAITNAIVHGNLGVSSALKELDDYGAFGRAVAAAMADPVLAARQVTVDYIYDGRSAVFRIEDEGMGFDWRKAIRKSPEDNPLLPHGRGLIIIRTFASKVEFNGKGNVITLTFSLVNPSCRE